MYLPIRLCLKKPTNIHNVFGTAKSDSKRKGREHLKTARDELQEQSGVEG